MPGFFCHHPNIQSLSHCRWQTILNNVHRITENICYNVFPENEQSESFRKMKTSDFFGVKFRCFALKVRMFLSKKSGVFDFREAVPHENCREWQCWVRCSRWCSSSSIVRRQTSPQKKFLKKNIHFLHPFTKTPLYAMLFGCRIGCRITSFGVGLV